MKLHLSIERSGKHFAGSRWLSLALVAILSVPGAGFATLRGTVSPRSLGAKAGTESPAQTAGKSSVTPLKFSAQDGVTPLAGSVFAVNSSADPGTLTNCKVRGGLCTLRAAIDTANTTAGDDTIIFAIPATDPNCDASTGRCTINLSQPLSDLSTNIAITGPGADKLTVRRGSSLNFRLFNVTTTGAVSFSGLTISDGSTSGTATGAGIQNAGGGTVTITNCDVRSNSSGIVGSGSVANGGGISNDASGVVNVSSTRITGNKTNGAGGGVYNNSTGTINITNSLISRNSSRLTFGTVFNKGGGTINVTNCSVLENDNDTSISSGGSSIGNGDTGAVNVSNCTIMNNAGVGISGPATVKSTIIAGNGLSIGPTDVSGSFVSAGFNLIGIADGATGFDASTDQKGSPSDPLDPQVDLGNIINGIIIPRCGSPALDKGTSASLAGPLSTDQRGTGFPRTIDDPLSPNAADGDGTDVGAIESQAVCRRATLTVNTTGDADDANPGGCR